MRAIDSFGGSPFRLTFFSFSVITLPTGARTPLFLRARSSLFALSPPPPGDFIFSSRSAFPLDDDLAPSNFFSFFFFPRLTPFSL